MKTMAQSKQIPQIIALLIALVFLLSACGGTPNSSSQASSDASTDSTASTDGTSSKDTSSKGSSSSKTSSGTVSTKPGSTVFSSDPYADISADAKKKDVHVLMWRPYTPTEQTLVDGFTKRTGIKVTTTKTTENEYATKLISLIAGGNSPDALLVASENFPSFVVNSMAPLDPKVFRLDDPIWNKTYMDCYKVNGKYYSVAISGIWCCEDTSYVTYYNPYVLADCGIAESSQPYNLYKQGKWNWTTQRDIANKVYQKNKTYTGISFQDYDLMMLSAGVDFIKYDGTKFTNNISNINSGDFLVKAWTEMAQLNADKLISSWNKDNVVNGKVGLFSAIAYGLYKEGQWFDGVKTQNGVQGLKAVPMAGPENGTAYTPIRPKTWGVAKGADNAEGGAFFLRYFLDPKNANMDNTFYNSEFKEIFNTITAKNAKKAVKVSSGVLNYQTAGSYGKLLSELTIATPANITSVLNTKKNSIDAGVTKANSILKKK